MSASAQTTADASAAVSSAAGTIAAVVAVVQFNAPLVLWSIVNLAQIMELFVPMEGYKPDDAIGMLSGEGGIPITTSFIPEGDVPLINDFADWVDIHQIKPDLEIIKLDSGSSIRNTISFAMTLVLLGIIHLIIIMIPDCKPKDETQKCKSMYYNAKRKIASLFLMSIYIRTIFETFQYLALVVFSDFMNNGFDGVAAVFSFIFALVICVLLIGFFGWSIYCYHASNSVESVEELKSREFINGVRNTRWAKLYSAFSLLRRLIFCFWIVFFTTVGSQGHPIGILLLQIPYLIFILAVQPLEEVKDNIVESINEVFFTFLTIFLIIYNKESEWSDTVTKIFINSILAAGTLVALVMLVVLIITIVTLIKESCSKKEEESSEQDQLGTKPMTPIVQIIIKNEK